MMPPRSHLCALSQRPRMPVQVQFLELVAVSLLGSNWFSRVPMFRRFKFLLDVSDCRDTTRSVFGRLASQLKAHRTSFYSTLYFTCHTMPLRCQATLRRRWRRSTATVAWRRRRPKQRGPTGRCSWANRFGPAKRAPGGLKPSACPRDIGVVVLDAAECVAALLWHMSFGWHAVLRDSGLAASIKASPLATTLLSWTPCWGKCSCRTVASR